MTHRNARSLHAIIGALVGDAASLGFHWLYDQELIRQFGSPHPEFHQPNRLNTMTKVILPTVASKSVTSPTMVHSLLPC
nr:hypothetical protein [Vibrio campbellii]